MHTDSQPVLLVVRTIGNHTIILETLNELQARRISRELCESRTIRGVTLDVPHYSYVYPHYHLDRETGEVKHTSIPKA